MEEHQLETMLSIERICYSTKFIKSHPDRRIIALGLHKLSDDEKMSDDVFALTMNIFDRFILKYSAIMNAHYCQLIALSCYNLAKKLRSNISINNENEQTSLILLNQNYTDEEIFDAEQLIVETLDWDLSTVVPHDYIHLIFQYIPLTENDKAKIRLHVNTLLSITICELNTLTIFPSILCCASIRVAINGLSIIDIHYNDELIMKTIHCTNQELIKIQQIIEQIFQSYVPKKVPATKRPCLAQINTSNKTHSSSPRVK
ncbi:unnamed protein product [Adineta steineri]|uniref:Uncharacterized protein n=1 Tax=Adineta steineri TaxID=433720 RepID=A0A814EJB2_9BILA|nr:unnamed protein product [Adineta steineri]CAF1037402.1 unnamed protein product [Adineta steineri]